MTQGQHHDRATLAEVAARAGVSAKTASRALNGERYVSPTTYSRVLTAAAELGFRVNAVARDLRTQSRGTSVGLLIGDVSNPFYARVARGAERRLHTQGLRLITASTEENPGLERSLVEEFLERRVAGIMIVTSADRHDYVERERLLGTPIIFIDRAPADIDTDTVVLDNRGGIRAAVDRLTSLGHTRIALITYMARLSTSHERSAAFFDAMAEQGLDGHKYVRDDCYDPKSAASAVRELLSLPEPPTAVISTNNRITAGVLEAVQVARSRISTIGFDDFELADLLGVTVVSHDAEQMGAHAADLLLARLAGDESTTKHIVVPTALVERPARGPYGLGPA